jgi:uncharacterized membrane protein YkoI
MLLVALATSVSLFADEDHDEDEHDDFERARRLSESGQIVPLENILGSARRLFPNGKILEIEFEDKAGRYFYEIEMLDQEGVVKELKFDARDGRHLGTKLEH